MLSLTQKVDKYIHFLFLLKYYILYVQVFLSVQRYIDMNTNFTVVLSSSFSGTQMKEKILRLSVKLSDR